MGRWAECIAVEITGKYLCNEIWVSVGSLLVVDTGFSLYATIKQIYYTADNALLHFICALLIFRLRKLGKLTLNCSVQSSLTSLSRRHQSVAQVRLSTTRETQSHAALQIKTIRPRALANNLMCVNKFKMQLLSIGTHKNAAWAWVQ